MSKKGKRVFALALAVLMALAFVLPAATSFVHADDGYGDEEQNDFSDEKSQIADLNGKYKDLQTAKTQLDAKISSAKTEKQKQLAAKEQIIGQINNTIAQIDVLTERIALLGQKIETKETEMVAKQGDIDANFELLKKRMRAMYMTGGSANTIGMVLGAESYSQFLMRAEVVSRVAQHDQDLLDELAAEKAELAAMKADIEEDKAGVEADKAEMDAKNSELESQKSEAQNRIQTLADTEAAFMADKENLQKQMQQVQAEISKIYAEINKTSSKLPYVGGVMQWPTVTSLTQISSSFGIRFGGSDNHTGIDITGAGAYGQPVFASNAGTVAVANLSFTPGYGYGKYVIVDHGGGIQTLYGHCSALNVKVGDVVSTGQKIAEIGSTGWSTGPHVHYEVRRNGKAENPASWLNG